MPNQGSGTGKGGKSFQERETAAKLRSKTMSELLLILDGKHPDEELNDVAFKKQVLLKLTGQILPRLNEHVGDNGEPIQHSIKVTFGS